MPKITWEVQGTSLALTVKDGPLTASHLIRKNTSGAAAAAILRAVANSLDPQVPESLRRAAESVVATLPVFENGAWRPGRFEDSRDVWADYLQSFADGNEMTFRDGAWLNGHDIDVISKAAAEAKAMDSPAGKSDDWDEQPDGGFDRTAAHSSAGHQLTEEESLANLKAQAHAMATRFAGFAKDPDIAYGALNRGVPEYTAMGAPGIPQPVAAGTIAVGGRSVGVSDVRVKPRFNTENHED